MNEIITLAHGSGGRLTHNLISDIFHKYFKNELLLETGDSAVFEAESRRMAFTTDSYVISPIFFRGGNIGKLAVCGTVNDLAVSGAQPKYLSCGFIIEEGLQICELESIVESMAVTAIEAGVKIITGDTKVVQKGCADKLFINTSGIGFVPAELNLSAKQIKVGDKIIISGTMGDHGTSILLERENLCIQSTIISDCALLNSMIGNVISAYPDSVRIMRDPTRGGVATTLNELAYSSNLGFKLYEEALPIKQEVAAICEMFGFDPLYMANEGKVIIIADNKDADNIIKLLKQHYEGKDAAIIGEVMDAPKGKVLMNTIVGSNRIIDMLVGDQLPRIC